MNSKSGPVVKTVSLQLVIILSVFAFFLGCIAGILFCAKLAHDEPHPSSGTAENGEISYQIETLQRDVKKNPNNAVPGTQLGNMYFDKRLN